MLTVAQRTRKRKEHKDVLEKDKENLRIKKLLEDDNYSKHLLLGILATTGTLPDFSLSKVCKCCGKSAKRFTSDRHHVCTDCLGQSFEGTIVPEWAKEGIKFTIRFTDGTSKNYTSINSAAKELGVAQPGLLNLVIGFWSQYKGLTADVIPNIKTIDDLKALRTSKSLK